MIKKIIKYINDPYNLILIATLVFTFILRLKYFNINSALWWDEATYLNVGKYWAYGHPLWDLEAARPPLFHLLIAFFFKIGFNETLIRLFLVVIPSTLIVLFTYLIGKKFYNEKIGLISSFIMSVFWGLLFNTTRFHTDALAFLLGLAGIYYFWKGYTQKEKINSKYLVLMSICLGLGFLVRLSTLLVILPIIIFLLITERLNFLKKKEIWFSIIIFFSTLSIYLIYGLIKFHSLIPWAEQYLRGAKETTIQNPIAFHLLTYIKLFTLNIYFIFFLIGLITLYSLILSLDLILKREENKHDNDLFMVIIFLIVLTFFMFITRYGDERWMLLMSLPIFIITAKGFIFIYDKIKNYNKLILLTLIIILFILSSYQQLKYNEDLINIKRDSYLPLKEASLYVKDKTSKEDNIMSINEQAQVVYYSERNTDAFYKNEEKTLEKIKEKNIKYVIISGYFNSPQWNFEMPQKYPETFRLEQIYFLDPEKTKPIVYVFKIEKNSI